jgi:cytochrome c
MRPLLLLSLALVLPAMSSAQAQNVAAGEKLFSQCRACHQVGDTVKDEVGPVLNGLFGRKAGMVEGYTYSPANKNSGLTWDEATFREYIKDPKAKVPGTKMVYPGIKDEKKVDDLIAYLHQFDKAPVKSAQ